MRPINEIIVHATATPPNWRAGSKTSAKVSAIRQMHKDRGFRDVGYHFLIDRDGTVAKGRPIEQIGAHVKGHNTGTVGIALFGGHGGAATDRFEDHYTPEQDAALRTLIDDLKRTYPTINKVSPHHAYAAKACPCFDVRRWLDGKQPRTSPAQSTTLQAAGLTSAGVLGGAGAAVGALDDTAQLVVVVAAVVAMAGLAWIARERLRKWAAGIR